MPAFNKNLTVNYIDRQKFIHLIFQNDLKKYIKIYYIKPIHIQNE